MKTMIAMTVITAALLSGCAYHPPAGYTEAEVSGCKGEIIAGRAATFILTLPLAFFGMGDPRLPKPSVAIDNCLSDLHRPNA